MATEQFRQDVQSTIEAWRLASFPEVPAYYENAPVPDEASMGPIWIDVQIRWYGAGFATMGVRPMGRHSGVISVNVYYRSGEGTMQPDRVLDSVKEILRARRLGPALLRMPQRTIPTDISGWYKAGIMVPFTLDDA